MDQSQDYPETIDLDAILCLKKTNSRLNKNSKSYSNISTNLVMETGVSCHFTDNTLLYKDELDIIQKFPRPSLSDLKDKFIFLGPKIKKYTLLLDLDHTLVCTSFDQTCGTSSAHALHLSLRPFASDMLKKLSLLYEIIVFTASCKEYANCVVRAIDPENKFIEKVISHEHCIEMSGGYLIKDLRIFQDRNINEMVIVDDYIYSFAFNIGNGIPVSRFDDDENDKELERVTQYLVQLYEFEGDLLMANKTSLWTSIEL